MEQFCALVCVHVCKCVYDRLAAGTCAMYQPFVIHYSPHSPPPLLRSVVHLDRLLLLLHSQRHVQTSGVPPCTNRVWLSLALRCSSFPWLLSHLMIRNDNDYLAA
jgi:hypothetical protein